MRSFITRFHLQDDLFFKISVCFNLAFGVGGIIMYWI